MAPIAPYAFEVGHLIAPNSKSVKKRRQQASPSVVQMTIHKPVALSGAKIRIAF